MLGFFRRFLCPSAWNGAPAHPTNVTFLIAAPGFRPLSIFPLTEMKTHVLVAIAMDGCHFLQLTRVNHFRE